MPVIKASIEEVQDLDATDRGKEDSVQQVFKNKFSTSDYKKYSKQIILKKFGIIGQKKIFSSKI